MSNLTITFDVEPEGLGKVFEKKAEIRKLSDGEYYLDTDYILQPVVRRYTGRDLNGEFSGFRCIALTPKTKKYTVIKVEGDFTKGGPSFGVIINRIFYDSGKDGTVSVIEE